MPQPERKLRINWVEGRPSLSGGIKSNRLLAEAMGRRGHTVTICHISPGRAWPKLTNPRQFLTRLREAIRAARVGYRHHLESADVPLVCYSRNRLVLEETPDADVTIASWWDVWRRVAMWPDSKGVKVHLVRGHETYTSAPTEEVESAYRIPGPKVAISGWLERILREEYGHADVVRVANGVDRKQFNSPPRDKQPVPTIGMLLGPGSAKNSRMGLEAVKIIEQTHPGLRVIAFGKRDPDPDWPKPCNFEFHREPAQDLIPRLYQSCDCWVISSRSEGFGMPGIEAAAGHCPLVATRSGGPEDFVRDGINGYLVDIDDVPAMADRVRRVLDLTNQQWRSMSAASFEIAQEFDWDRSAEKLEAALYRWIDQARAAHRGA